MNWWLSLGRESLTEIDPKVLWFLVVGGVNTLLGFGLFPFVYWTLAGYRSHYVLLLVVCHITTVLNAYLTNKFFVFRTQGYSSAEIMKFGVFHLVYFLVMISLVPLLVEFWDINPVVTQFSMSVLVVVVSFFWYDKVVFLAKDHVVELKDDGL